MSDLDQDDLALIAQLRALPDESADGAEPDWTAMQRNIRLAIADQKPRRRWWIFALPALAIGGAAAILALSLHQRELPAPVATARPALVEEHHDSSAVYLDGEAVDIDAADPSDLDEDERVGAAERDEPVRVGLEEDPAPPDIASDDDSLLPTDHWIDRLDDRALDHVAKILDKKKS